MQSRRKFLKLTALGIGGFFFSGCVSGKSSKNIRFTVKEHFSSRGHQLWTKQVPGKNITQEKADVVIIGAGISGLAAAYHLKKAGISNFTILELADKPGGNSASGSNEHSAYPYGAHYLTLPNPENKALISFLHEKGIIRGFDAGGKPEYNETDLCFDPEERLLIRGNFQEGLVPAFGIEKVDQEEIGAFFKLMEEYRHMKGEDGNYFFTLPCSLTSIDKKLDHLDGITFSDYLQQQGFKSKYLLWYLDYCCRDDYGGDSSRISAWAGINYFAAHRAQAANTDASRILTWPEGNGRLVKLLCETISENIRTGNLVKQIAINNGQVKVMTSDFKTGTVTEIMCKTCIVSIPPFVASRILDPALSYPFNEVKLLKHTPWVVAAVTLEQIPEGRGTGLCWDNVAFGAGSLGYIYNQHQELSRHSKKPVISLYIPLDEGEDVSSRKKTAEVSNAAWEQKVTEELESMHPGISKYIEEIELCIWGHGMILPTKNLLKSDTLKKLAQPIENKIFFAHTDLSAYSVFEEAFDQGYRAAEMVKKALS